MKLLLGLLQFLNNVSMLDSDEVFLTKRDNI